MQHKATQNTLSANSVHSPGMLRAHIGHTLSALRDEFSSFMRLEGFINLNQNLSPLIVKIPCRLQWHFFFHCFWQMLIS